MLTGRIESQSYFGGTVSRTEVSDQGRACPAVSVLFRWNGISDTITTELRKSDLSLSPISVERYLGPKGSGISVLHMGLSPISVERYLGHPLKGYWPNIGVSVLFRWNGISDGLDRLRDRRLGSQSYFGGTVSRTRFPLALRSLFQVSVLFRWNGISDLITPDISTKHASLSPISVERYLGLTADGDLFSRKNVSVLFRWNGISDRHRPTLSVALLSLSPISVERYLGQ